MPKERDMSLIKDLKQTILDIPEDYKTRFLYLPKDYEAAMVTCDTKFDKVIGTLKFAIGEAFEIALHPIRAPLAATMAHLNPKRAVVKHMAQEHAVASR